MMETRRSSMRSFPTPGRTLRAHIAVTTASNLFATCSSVFPGLADCLMDRPALTHNLAFRPAHDDAERLVGVGQATIKE